MAFDKDKDTTKSTGGGYQAGDYSKSRQSTPSSSQTSRPGGSTPSSSKSSGGSTTSNKTSQSSSSAKSTTGYGGGQGSTNKTSQTASKTPSASQISRSTGTGTGYGPSGFGSAVSAPTFAQTSRPTGGTGYGPMGGVVNRPVVGQTSRSTGASSALLDITAGLSPINAGLVTPAAVMKAADKAAQKAKGERFTEKYLRVIPLSPNPGRGLSPGGPTPNRVEPNLSPAFFRDQYSQYQRGTVPARTAPTPPAVAATAPFREPVTRQEIIEFQKQNGLVPDGIKGPETRRAIEGAKAPIPTPGPRGPAAPAPTAGVPMPPAFMTNPNVTPPFTGNMIEALPPTAAEATWFKPAPVTTMPPDFMLGGLGGAIQTPTGLPSTAGALPNFRSLTPAEGPIPEAIPRAAAATEVSDHIMTRDEIIEMIKEGQRIRGITGDVPLNIAIKEGLNANPAEGYQSTIIGPNGKRENSFGVFQLNVNSGVGKEFIKDTGLDPRDPLTTPAQINYTLDWMVEHGVHDWSAAKNVLGYDKWEGMRNAKPAPAAAAVDRMTTQGIPPEDRAAPKGLGGAAGFEARSGTTGLGKAVELPELGPEVPWSGRGGTIPDLASAPKVKFDLNGKVMPKSDIVDRVTAAVHAAVGPDYEVVARSGHRGPGGSGRHNQLALDFETRHIPTGHVLDYRIPADAKKMDQIALTGAGSFGTRGTGIGKDYMRGTAIHLDIYNNLRPSQDNEWKAMNRPEMKQALADARDAYAAGVGGNPYAAIGTPADTTDTTAPSTVPAAATVAETTTAPRSAAQQAESQQMAKAAADRAKASHPTAVTTPVGQGYLSNISQRAVPATLKPTVPSRTGEYKRGLGGDIGAGIIDFLVGGSGLGIGMQAGAVILTGDTVGGNVVDRVAGGKPNYYQPGSLDRQSDSSGEQVRTDPTRRFQEKYLTPAATGVAPVVTPVVAAEEVAVPFNDPTVRPTPAEKWGSMNNWARSYT